MLRVEKDWLGLCSKREGPLRLFCETGAEEGNAMGQPDTIIKAKM